MTRTSNNHRQMGFFYSITNFQLQFLEISSGELNSIFYNFWKKGQPCKVWPNFRIFFPGIFPPWTFPGNSNTIHFLFNSCRISRWVESAQEYLLKEARPKCKRTLMQYIIIMFVDENYFLTKLPAEVTRLHWKVAMLLV